MKEITKTVIINLCKCYYIDQSGEMKFSTFDFPGRFSEKKMKQAAQEFFPDVKILHEEKETVSSSVYAVPFELFYEKSVAVESRPNNKEMVTRTFINTKATVYILENGEPKETEIVLNGDYTQEQLNKKKPEGVLYVKSCMKLEEIRSMTLKDFVAAGHVIRVL